jgi:hypothetical protein
MEPIIALLFAVALTFSPATAYAQEKPLALFGKVSNEKPRKKARAKVFSAPRKASAVAPAPVKADFPGLLGKLKSVTLEDLRSADAIAQKQGNTVSHQCWAAWISFLEAQKAAAVDDKGNPVQLPAVHLITDAENAIDFVNQVSSTGPIGVACAPLANQVRMSALNLITSIASGTLLGGLALP